MAVRQSTRRTRTNVTLNLTKREIEALEHGPKVRTIYDVKQHFLQLRLLPGGRKTWQVLKSHRGHPVAISLWRELAPKQDYISSPKIGAWLNALPWLMTDSKADPGLWRDLFLFWTLTGARNGEAKRLRWEKMWTCRRTPWCWETRRT